MERESENNLKALNLLPGSEISSRVGLEKLVKTGWRDLVVGSLIAALSEVEDNCGVVVIINKWLVRSSHGGAGRGGRGRQVNERPRHPYGNAFTMERDKRRSGSIGSDKTKDRLNGRKRMSFDSSSPSPPTTTIHHIHEMLSLACSKQVCTALISAGYQSNDVVVYSSCYYRVTSWC